jgi:hypothetical protein
VAPGNLFWGVRRSPFADLTADERGFTQITASAGEVSSVLSVKSVDYCDDVVANLVFAQNTVILSASEESRLRPFAAVKGDKKRRLFTGPAHIAL